MHLKIVRTVITYTCTISILKILGTRCFDFYVCIRPVPCTRERRERSVRIQAFSVKTRRVFSVSAGPPTGPAGLDRLWWRSMRGDPEAWQLRRDCGRYPFQRRVRRLELRPLVILETLWNILRSSKTLLDAQMSFLETLVRFENVLLHTSARFSRSVVESGFLYI